MTDSQKVEKLKALTGETDEVLLNTFLDTLTAPTSRKSLQNMKWFR